MKMNGNIFFFFFAILLSLPFSPPSLHAATNLKIASMAPKGTTWANALDQMANDVKSKTNGEVVFRVFSGGVQGDEPNVLRKIRIGQLHGGVFTGKALGEINGDVRVMEIPFNFLQDREKAWKTLNEGVSLFNKGFTKNGFKNLGFFEIGQVYLVSTQELKSIDGLKGRKIWSWDGDQISSTLIETLHLVGVPLNLQDVLSSLSTGIIDTAYSSPLGILALQWQTKIKYLIDFPVTYSVGALVVQEKFFQGIPEKHRALVEQICKQHIDQANLNTIKENEEALASLKKTGVKFIPFSKEDITQGKKVRLEVMGKLKGKLFTEEAVNFLNKQI